MQNRSVGIAALIAAVWLLVGNLTHPVGTTDMYADGAALVEHTTNTYWIVNHLLLSLALLVPPWLVFAWSRTLTLTQARTWGTYAVILVGLGTVVGVLHLGGIDGVALPAYGEVLASGGAAAAAGADVLAKVHLASITAWSLIYWGAAQTIMGITELMERTRRWLGWLLVVCGVLGFAFAVTIAIQGQLTELSEGLLLRGSTVGLTVWLILTAWKFARSPEVIGSAP